MNDKRKAKPGDTLSRLFAKISQKVKLDSSKIRENNKRYVSNPANKLMNDSGKRSSAAGNILKELERPTMTWRVFEKLIRWMNPKAAKVIVVIDWQDGLQTVDTINLRIEDHLGETVDVDLEELQVCDLSNEQLKRILIDRGEAPVHIPGINDDLLEQLYPDED